MVPEIHFCGNTNIPTTRVGYYGGQFSANRSKKALDSELHRRKYCGNINIPTDDLSVNQLLGGITRMELLPYNEFSSLHIRQFLPLEAYEEVLDEVEHSLLGFCRCKSYYTTTDWDLEFLYPDSPPTVLAGVSAETGGAVPAQVTQRVLTTLRLPFSWGASASDIHALLGAPYYVTPRDPDRPSVFDVHRFHCGIQWPYEVGCCIWPDRGCQRLWVVRADYFHDDD